MPGTVYDGVLDLSGLRCGVSAIGFEQGLTGFERRAVGIRRV